MAAKVNTKWFLINAVAFILAIFPLMFREIFYYIWTEKLVHGKETFEDVQDERKQAIIARLAAESSSFFFQLIWIYVLHSLGIIKPKK